jgi:hypothetical protein
LMCTDVTSSCNRESCSPSTETSEMVSACLNGALGAT